MTSRLTSSISPFIYPLYPKRAGHLRYVIDVGKFFNYEFAKDYDGPLTITTTTWIDGQLMDEERQLVTVCQGSPETELVKFGREGLDCGIGYLEIHITANAPIFDRLLFENNFGVLRREGFGSILITDTPKFADVRIIEQIREIGSYCMAHTGVSIDRSKGYGDYFLLINPYDQDLVVRLESNQGLKERIKVPSKTAQATSLEALAGNGIWASVSLTAKQRVLVYDVKAPIDDPYLPVSLDHLDPFRGEAALRPATPIAWIKHKTRAAARRLQLSTS